VPLLEALLYCPSSHTRGVVDGGLVVVNNGVECVLVRGSVVLLLVVSVLRNAVVEIVLVVEFAVVIDVVELVLVTGITELLVVKGVVTIIGGVGVGSVGAVEDVVTLEVRGTVDIVRRELAKLVEEIEDNELILDFESELLGSRFKDVELEMLEYCSEELLSVKVDAFWVEVKSNAESVVVTFGLLVGTEVLIELEYDTDVLTASAELTILILELDICSEVWLEMIELERVIFCERDGAGDDDDSGDSCKVGTTVDTSLLNSGVSDTSGYKVEG
jgi:hypothetical protein